MRELKSEPGHYVATTAVMHKVKEFYYRQTALDFAGSAGKVEFVSDLRTPVTCKFCKQVIPFGGTNEHMGGRCLPKPHAPAVGQPGLWSHSVDPEHNVMKRYLVKRALFKPDGSPDGFLAMDSYDTAGEALYAVADEPVGSQVVDQSRKW